MSIKKTLKKSFTEKEALAKAIKWCSVQERCIHDTKQKLKMWDIDNALRDKIIKKLVNDQLVDDSKFAHAFTSGKFRINQWGRVKIAYELQNRNLSKTIVSKAINAINLADYDQVIERLTKRKAEEVREKDPETKKRKILFWLISKGFEPELILPKLKNIK